MAKNINLRELWRDLRRGEPTLAKAIRGLRYLSALVVLAAGCALLVVIYYYVLKKYEPPPDTGYMVLIGGTAAVGVLAFIAVQLLKRRNRLGVFFGSASCAGIAGGLLYNAFRAAVLRNMGPRFSGAGSTQLIVFDLLIALGSLVVAAGFILGIRYLVRLKTDASGKLAETDG